MTTDILAAVRDLGFLVVRGVTCGTCDGSGEYADVFNNEGDFEVVKCSTCKGLGLVPSPEVVEAAAANIARHYGPPVVDAITVAKAALMAAVDTEET